jgi:V-type H+-transporting ATPase subunit H
VLAVAAHDLGQYVKYYERGKKYVFSNPYPLVPSNSLSLPTPLLKPRIVTDLGAKTRAMELMSHGSQDVRYQALLSVQRLVSHPWQAV